MMLQHPHSPLKKLILSCSLNKRKRVLEPCSLLLDFTGGDGSCVFARSYLILCDPMDSSPPGSSVHGIFPGKNAGVVCHFWLQGIFPTQRSSPRLRQILYHCTTWEVLGGLSDNQILIRIKRSSLAGIYTGNFPRIYTGKLRANQQAFTGKRADMKHRQAEATCSCHGIVPLEGSVMSPCSGRDHSHPDPRELGGPECPWILKCLFSSGLIEALRSIIGFTGKLPSPSLFF